MKLENSFSVTAPLDQTWRTLLDIERVAACLPGAKIEPSDKDGVYRGAMKIKLGPMTVDYRGTARLQDVDEDTHTASIAVQGREAKGQGTAAAVIENRLEPQNGGTKVVAVTDLKITGRQAQFGRGIMEDVANTMMGEFAKRLEAEIKSGGTPAGAAERAAAAEPRREGAAEPPRAAPGAQEPEALDVGNVLARTATARYAGAGLVVALLALVALVLLRGNKRRSQFTVNLNLGK
jgi:carbon monoxide dehydrogenase subunit G